MNYEHTQRSPLHLILFAVAAALLIGAWLIRQQPPAVGLLILAAIFALLGLMFGCLTVRDEGQWLALRYGPLSMFRKRIAYDRITSVEAGRISVLDGWGIHYVPGRGMTYNLWGFGCVKLTLGRKVVRVGTDDAENLADFLQGKIAEREADCQNLRL